MENLTKFTTNTGTVSVIGYPPTGMNLEFISKYLVYFDENPDLLVQGKTINFKGYKFLVS